MDEQQTQVGAEAQAEGNDALRAVLDQFEAAERELRAADEVRRAREEDVNRLKGEIGGAVMAALESCRAERVEVEARLKGIDDRIQELEGIKGRYSSEGAVPPPPANPGWVTTDIPATTSPEVGGEVAAEGSEQPADQPVDQPAEQASGEVVAEGANRGAPEGEQAEGGSYEDGWYEVLKQRGKN